MVRAITGQPLDVHGARHAELDVVDVVHGVADDDDELDDFDDDLADVKTVNDVALLHVDTELLHLKREKDEMRRYIQNIWAPFQNLVDYLLVHYLHRQHPSKAS